MKRKRNAAELIVEYAHTKYNEFPHSSFSNIDRHTEGGKVVMN